MKICTFCFVAKSNKRAQKHQFTNTFQYVCRLTESANTTRTKTRQQERRSRVRRVRERWREGGETTLLADQIMSVFFFPFNYSFVRVFSEIHPSSAKFYAFQYENSLHTNNSIYFTNSSLYKWKLIIHKGENYREMVRLLIKPLPSTLTQLFNSIKIVIKTMTAILLNKRTIQNHWPFFVSFILSLVSSFRRKQF